MANLDELEQANPNIRLQLQIWQRERREQGLDPYDFPAFRKHELALGAPDIGEEEFPEFRAPEPKPAEEQAFVAEAPAEQPAAEQPTAEQAPSERPTAEPA